MNGVGESKSENPTQLEGVAKARLYCPPTQKKIGFIRDATEAEKARLLELTENTDYSSPPKGDQFVL